VKSVKKPSKISMELIAEAVPHVSAKPKIAPVAVAVAVADTVTLGATAVADTVAAVEAVEAVMKDTAVTEIAAVEIAAVEGATTVSATGACKILRKFLFQNKTAPV
jgi:hypothetical protein